MPTGGHFFAAVQAIIGGDESTLRALLQAHPDLIHDRAPAAHAATLLHYVAANGVEVQRSPQNAPTIGRMLLEAGADVDAVASIYGTPAYDTTLCLTVTSAVPFLASVQTDLVDVLVDGGARVNGLDDDGAPLGCALVFGYTKAAERLVQRGARVDNVIYAAGLGMSTLSSTCSPPEPASTDCEADRWRAGRFSFPIPRDAHAHAVAPLVAAMHGRLPTVRVLLEAGLETPELIAAAAGPS